MGMAPMFVEPISGDIVGYIPEVRFGFWPPFLERLLNSTGVFKPRFQVLGVIVHSGTGRDFTSAEIASFRWNGPLRLKGEINDIERFHR